MFKRSSWIHLRVGFSYFLLPVFLFTLSFSSGWPVLRAWWVFLIVHLLLYPASNAYNSYYDKDEGPIGGLRHPPPVSKDLYYLALLFDAIGIILGILFLGYQFAIMLFVYGMVSKAYSHPSVRLKRWPWTSWLVAGFFQGFFTFMMCYMGLHDRPLMEVISGKTLIAASLPTLLLWGSYPMTQIYQHDEDARRGDRTLSLVLGVRGTFFFTAVAFTIASAGFFLFYATYESTLDGFLFLVFLLPVLGYFFYWFRLAMTDLAQVNYSNAMRLNFISSTCLNAFFVMETILNAYR